MHSSRSIFLASDKVRAINVSYKPGDRCTPFKTLDQTIKAGDLVVVPTDTRYNFTVSKVKDVDVDVDFESSDGMRWIAARVDLAEYENVLEQEKQVIATIRAAQLTKQRRELREALIGDVGDKLKGLPIYDVESKNADPST